MGSKTFQDFDYNTKRAKKASQVIMSINNDGSHQKADDDEESAFFYGNGNSDGSVSYTTPDNSLL